LNETTDRPPILRFLVLFMALLGVALGLAALSPAEAPAEPIASMQNEPQFADRNDANH
jgi:hypothetical protein